MLWRENCIKSTTSGVLWTASAELSLEIKSNSIFILGRKSTVVAGYLRDAMMDWKETNSKIFHDVNRYYFIYILFL